MKKLLIACLALVACNKSTTQYEYKGDLININIKSNNATLYVNNIQIRSNINSLDTNIFLFNNDDLRIVNNSNADTQNITATVNYRKYYSATYRDNNIYDSIKACPSRARIEYNDKKLIFNIAYIY